MKNRKKKQKCTNKQYVTAVQEIRNKLNSNYNNQHTQKTCYTKQRSPVTNIQIIQHMV